MTIIEYELRDHRGEAEHARVPMGFLGEMAVVGFSSDQLEEMGATAPKEPLYIQAVGEAVGTIVVSNEARLSNFDA